MEKSPHRTVRYSYLSALAWLIPGAVIGLWMAIIYSWPEVMYKLPVVVRPYVEYGRVRQIHVNTLAFAWLSLGFLGSLFYIIPKLSETELYSDKLGKITIMIWNLGILLGAVGLDLGYSRGREYASMTWPSDLCLVVAFILLNYNIWRTIANRKQKEMYVTIWYLAGSIVFMPIILILGKGLWANFFTNPFSGVFDNVSNWFLGHSILGLWFTTLALGITYYLFPQISNRPIYSHYLSVIGFWGLVLFYPAVGAHHTLSGPVPNWLMAEATVFSVLMVIPVSAAVYNLYKTVAPDWNKLLANTSFAFTFFGLFLYLFVSMQGSFQALKFVSKYLHYSQWVPGHAMLALGGAMTFINFGAIYYILPRIINRDWFSHRLTRWHLWLSVYGILTIFFSLTSAGLIQASNWADTGAGIHWIDATLRAVKPEMIGLALGGILFVAGQLVYLYNFTMTVRHGQKANINDINKLLTHESGMEVLA